MKKYYLHNGTENIGPFDLEDLKLHNLTKDTPIWYEGIEEWKTAGEIEELKSVLIVVPPPYVKKEETINTTPVIIEKQRSSLAWRITRVFLIGFLIVVAISVIVGIANNSNEPLPYSEMTIGETEATYPTDYLHTGGTYKPNFLGSKLKIDGFIENKASLTTYKDIVIEITYYSKTNTPLKTIYHTVYEFVSPATRQPFQLKVENYSDVESLGWKVSNATVK